MNRRDIIKAALVTPLVAVLGNKVEAQEITEYPFDGEIDRLLSGYVDTGVFPREEAENLIERMNVFDEKYALRMYAVGAYDERIHFFPDSEKGWTMEVSTSLAAIEKNLVQTVIWREVFDLPNYEEFAPCMTPEQVRNRKKAFLDGRRKYHSYMQSNFREHQWEAIALGDSFAVNADGIVSVGLKKIPLDEYVAGRWGTTTGELA